MVRQASRRAATDAAVAGDGSVLGPGEFERHDDTVGLADPDPGWADDYAREEKRLLAALGDRVVRLAHVGSTSVPGLIAKPVIDIVLEVPDAADEDSWVHRWSPPATASGGGSRTGSSIACCARPTTPAMHRRPAAERAHAPQP